MNKTSPSDQDIFERIAGLIREHLDEPDLPLEPSTSARDVEGWDSIVMINIILDVQKSFAVRFRSAEVDKLSSISDFVALTRRKIDASTGGTRVGDVA
jgi:acyl carrier protein